MSCFSFKMPYKSKTQKANQMDIENRWKRAREKSVIDENNNTCVKLYPKSEIPIHPKTCIGMHIFL